MTSTQLYELHATARRIEDDLARALQRVRRDGSPGLYYPILDAHNAVQTLRMQLDYELEGGMEVPV
jgi:hypothetical protein